MKLWRKTPWLVKLHFLFWLVYFSIFWSQAIKIDQWGNVFAQHINIWGDWAAHFTLGSNLAFDQLLTTQSPLLANQTLSYPFAANFISAVLIRLGLPFFQAFIWPSFLGSILLIGALYFFYQQLLNSKKLAVLASNLFLLSGGWGFIYFFKDLASSRHFWQTMLNPPQKYTNLEPLFYRFVSIINSMVIPQRAFNLGFPLALIALTLIYQSFVKKKKKQQKKSLQLIKVGLAILLLGLMPWLHTHSFLASFIMLVFWFFGDLRLQTTKPKNWLLLAFGVGLISLPIIKILFFNQVSHDFIKWFPGWYSYQFPQVNWFMFWLKNWGLTPILALIGLSLEKPRRRWLWLPFFTIFVLLNLFLFQPFIWDNTKLLVWVALGFSGLTALTVRFCWKNYCSPMAHAFLILVILSCALSASLDTYRALRFKLNRYQLYSAEEMELAAWVKKNTPPDSRWLTETNHNHWLFNLTGRQALMTYPGWLWTHGYDYYSTEADVRTMLEQPVVAEQQNLWEKHEVDYAVLSDRQKETWSAQGFELIKTSDHYRLYARSIN